MTCAGDREITPWLPPLPSGPCSAVRALRTPGAGAFRMGNHLSRQTSWDRCSGEGFCRHTAHGYLYAAPGV